MARDEVTLEAGSGNVFEDIGFDRQTAARLAYKAELVGVLHREMKRAGLSQSAFAKLVRIPQPKLSRLFTGRIDGISTDKLLDAIALLGAHVTIRVEPGRQGAGVVGLELVAA